MAGNLIRTVMSCTCLAALCGLLLAGSAEGSRHSSRAGSACLERLPGVSSMTPVGTIQGAAHTSPFRGRTVATTGIVTAVDTDGFYLQDPAGDGDTRTSDGVFVFTGRKPAAAVGDRLCVRGPVAEYQPGGAATNNLTITQITRPRVTRLSRRNRLPAPVPYWAWADAFRLIGSSTTTASPSLTPEKTASTSMRPSKACGSRSGTPSL